MNIFVLDRDLVRCARSHVNSHVVKMPLESSQMLCTNLVKKGVESPYLAVHRNHPCTLWAGVSRDNFMWLAELGLYLCEEYTFRYGKVHKCQEVIEYCIDKGGVIPSGSLTKFAQAMPDEHKRCDPVEGYREYYRQGKSHLAVWGNREKPEWY
jgi:hypothetical protein